MAEFGEENFPELQFLPYLIGGLALLVLIGAIIRKKGLSVLFNWFIYCRRDCRGMGFIPRSQTIRNQP